MNMEVDEGVIELCRTVVCGSVISYEEDPRELGTRVRQSLATSYAAQYHPLSFAF